MMHPDENIQRNRWHRAAVAVIFGLIGFAVNFLDIQLFESPEFKVSILLGLIFPLLIAMAWGWRYGLLSALAGGCQSMWWLWRSDGYGFLYAVPAFTLWVVWHGYWADQRAKAERPQWRHSAFVMEVPFRVFIELGFFTVFPWLVSFNPPPWNPEIAWTVVPIEWSVKVAIKHTIVAYLLLLAAHVLLSLTPIRRFLGLKKLPAERLVHAVYACSLLMGTALWMVDSVVTYLAFNPWGQTFWEIVILQVSPHEFFMRNIYFLISVMAGAFVARFLIQQKRAEEELAANYALLRIAGETARFGGWNVDLLNDTCTWSDTVADIHEVPRGYSPPVNDGIGFYAPEWREKITQVFRDCAEKGIPYDEEMEIITQKGKRVWIRTIGEAVKDENGNITKVRGAFQEITERKQTEEELRRLKDHLEMEVVAKTRELQETIAELKGERRKLEFSNQELEAFTYSVSHDLRAPLRHINGYIQLLTSRFHDALSEKETHYLESIADSANQMGTLIDNLLQLSRTGRQEMHRTRIDMNALLQDVLKTVDQDHSDRHIEWITADLPAVDGDYSLMKLVWENLLSNAVKFTQKKEQAIIKIGFKEGEKEPVFFVRDNGTGFEMKYAHKLFGVFQRLHPATDYEGTGIGLANVRRIIQRHGGRTWAEAAPEKGATFYFSLPVKDEKEPIP